ncbi:dnaJ homolog subfamily B member 14-like [Drosophila madeirensis]|uniref:DnaJ homolog subfamily B member 14-like n=1 Tax=Drosophila madeirensis TaxID=30013 RepID=A0AAU9EPS4_DROMD
MDEQVEAMRPVNAVRNNCYAFLNVPQTATNEQISSAYRQWSRLVHPDKKKYPGATDAFQVIASSKDVLMDVPKRHHFDQQLRHAIDGNN